jgi:hypothetical protein
MHLIRGIRAAFTFPQRPPVETSTKKRKSDRRIVEAHSNGNIRLQLGQYSTRADIDSQYARVKNFTFD